MEKLKKIMNDAGIIYFGSIPFSALGPLLDCRAKSRIPAGAKSVIVSLIPYNVGDFHGRNISKYAVSADYHLIAEEIFSSIVEKLKAIYTNDKFEFFADNSPIREVDAALKAGLGVLGDNGLLINQRFGSYVFIGEIVTTAEILPYKNSEIKTCLHCGRCQKACPDGALPQKSLNQSFCQSFGFSFSFNFNEDLCLSALTQKKGELSPLEEEKIKAGGLVWGCDICQDVCPLNKNAEKTNITKFYETALPIITNENVDAVIKTRAFNWRGIKTIKRNLNIINGENKF